jgi:hypothetical protein
MKMHHFADAAKTNPIKPNQTQYKANTNPIPERPKMNENLFATKVYENITTFRLRKNKPNQTQFQKQKAAVPTPQECGFVSKTLVF